MALILSINGEDEPAAAYIGWSPVPCGVRLAGAARGPVPVIVRNGTAEGPGQLVFSDPASQVWRTELRLTLPADGTPVPFDAAGRFGFASARDKDAAIHVLAVDGHVPPAVVALMVRIRKNAETLADHERDRFLFALAGLDDAGAGLFRDFRQIHVSQANDEMHSCPAFLPWHRAFILDLERELQVIDPSVTLPYWRFDMPAGKVFSQDFMGEEDRSGRARFSARNPLLGWVSNGVPGVTRKSGRQIPARYPVLGVGALALVDAAETFEELPIENRIHAPAHRQFRGLLEDPHVSVSDPVFFLLHANVDRIWARWQRERQKRDGSAPGSYVTEVTRIGYRLGDTMWPWNEDTNDPRPPFAPGGSFPSVRDLPGPGPRPRVGDVFDYQGTLSPANRLGFDYDDVPFPGIPPL